MKNKTRVAIVRASEHNTLQDAVAAAMHLLDIDNRLKATSNILLKPNLLMKSKKACTEADFIEAVIAHLKQYQREIALGDSPGQFGHKAKDIIKFIGAEHVFDDENVKYVEFESAVVKVSNHSARHMRDYFIAKPIYDADIIVNLPRPKSHIEACYTGAVKNFWGIIPGGEKARCHLYGKNPDAFGNVLIDNYETLRSLGKEIITIMDARQFMEGASGPASGPMRDVGLIIAGTDDVAVDMVMLAIAGWDGIAEVPHLNACRQRGIGISDLSDIEIVGRQIAEVKLKQKIKIVRNRLAVVSSFMSSNIFYKIVKRMPKTDNTKCIKCGDCFKICPAKAIIWEKKQYPQFMKDKCISCMCCVECCPEHALQGTHAGLSGLFAKEPD